MVLFLRVPAVCFPISGSCTSEHGQPCMFFIASPHAEFNNPAAGSESALAQTSSFPDPCVHVLAGHKACFPRKTWLLLRSSFQPDDSTIPHVGPAFGASSSSPRLDQHPQQVSPEKPARNSSLRWPGHTEPDARKQSWASCWPLPLALPALEDNPGWQPPLGALWVRAWASVH